MKALLAVLVLLVAGPVQAQKQACGDRKDVLNYYATQHKEAPVAMGLLTNGSLIEVVTSKDGSWTILVTKPSGRTCAVAAGRNWESIATELDDTGT